MAFDKYSVTQYSVSSILGFIEAGDIAIPEIQRPFVWQPKDVRNLIDSLYNGYPTGYLIIWQNPNVRLKDGKEATGKKILIDGQQRITALMTAISGHEILTSDYQRKVIRIAFNPLAQDDEERFAVKTPIHDKDKKWIPDISVLFKPDFSQFKFLMQYATDNPEANPDQVEQALTRLLAVKACQLGAIVLVPQLDINEVTEIFVRINSRGKSLNAADFAMSKIAADDRFGGNMLRKAIDYFCHLAVEPSFYGQLKNHDSSFMASEYEPQLRWLKDDNGDIYDPDYGDMLRVSFMHVFGRGKLADLVSLLSGRDFETRTFRLEIAEDSFQRLRTGVHNFMNEYNFSQFVLAIKSAGFISGKLLTSQMTLDFAYTLYLTLANDPSFPKVEIKKWVQKWFILSMVTGRYVNSPESQMDRDIRGIAEKGFLNFFQEAEASQLSENFWDVSLVQNLETSSISSPYFNIFIAAQIYNAELSLLSNSSKVSDLITTMGDVHHIFPKEYLKKNGIAERSKYNQVANYVYLDTGVNISIGKKAPKDYFTAALTQCYSGNITTGTISDRNLFLANLEANCIPADIVNMTFDDYDEFLIERRKMMAKKIKKYYQSL